MRSTGETEAAGTGTSRKGDARREHALKKQIQKAPVIKEAALAECKA